MSESTIPFQGGGTALLERPGPDLEPEQGNGGGNRVKLLALGGLAAALVLGLVAYFLLFAGGDEPSAAPVSKPDNGASQPVAPAEGGEASTVTTPKISAKNFGRDPFKPLIVEPEAAVDTGTGTSTATGGTTTATGGTTTGGTTTGGTTTGGTSTPATSTAYTFKVVEVAPDNSTITVKVNGEVYRNLRAGEVFADYFKVRLISGSVNSFQYGEETFNVVGTKKLTIG